jgi:hypothetical protein
MMPYRNPNTPPVQTEQPLTRRYQDGHCINRPMSGSEKRDPTDALWQIPDDDQTR